MSVLNKKPYIALVLEGLSEENQVKLGNLINGQGDRTELQRILGLPSGNRTPITEADKGAHLCSLQIGPTLYEGYLLYTDDKCCLVWFTDFQTLSMFDINVAKQTFAVVSEYLDIVELRSSLNDLLIESGHAVKVQAGDVDSGSATAGQVLKADGAGGAGWGDAGSGGVAFIQVDARVEGTNNTTVEQVANALHAAVGTGNSDFVELLYYSTQGPDVVTVSKKMLHLNANKIHSTMYAVFYTDTSGVEYGSHSSLVDGSELFTNATNRIKITNNEISSSSATSGQVLTADGSGETSWQNPSGGGTQLYRHEIVLETSENTQRTIIAISAASGQATNFSSMKDVVFYENGQYSTTKIVSLSFLGIPLIDWIFQGPPMSPVGFQAYYFDHGSSSIVELGSMSTFVSDTVTAL